ncbi:MAG: hypothetical protein GX794_01715 [Acholeplasmataceae bacterium]|jgi:hypothetical protein|nr:hypothetical protein [Acholeplasmataceae bacterium]
MLKLTLEKQLEKKLLIQNIILFAFFMLIYSMLDYLGYRDSKNNGLEVKTIIVVFNIILNLLIAFISMLTIGISTANMKLSGKEIKGSSFWSSIAIALGFVTFGCTSCVVTFLASIGITFISTASFLIGNGIWFKLLSFLLVVIGFLIVAILINKARCKVNLNEASKA